MLKRYVVGLLCMVSTFPSDATQAFVTPGFARPAPPSVTYRMLDGHYELGTNTSQYYSCTAYVVTIGDYDPSKKTVNHHIYSLTDSPRDQYNPTCWGVPVKCCSIDYKDITNSIVQATTGMAIPYQRTRFPVHGLDTHKCIVMTSVSTPYGRTYSRSSYTDTCNTESPPAPINCDINVSPVIQHPTTVAVGGRSVSSSPVSVRCNRRATVSVSVMSNDVLMTGQGGTIYSGLYVGQVGTSEVPLLVDPVGSVDLINVIDDVGKVAGQYQGSGVVVLSWD